MIAPALEELEAEYLCLCMVFGDNAALAVGAEIEAAYMTIDSLDRHDYMRMVKLDLTQYFFRTVLGVVNGSWGASLPLPLISSLGNFLVPMRANALVKYMQEDRALSRVGQFMPLEMCTLEMVGMAANEGHMDLAKCIATVYAQNNPEI